MVRVVMSRCLGLAACRFDGTMVKAPWLQRLSQVAEIIGVCPEEDAGLGTPRPPICLRKHGEQTRVVVCDSGEDITPTLEAFAQGYLGSLKPVDAFVLKSKSPSCGLGTAKIFNDGSYTLGDGLFAAIAKAQRPEAVLVDEAFMEEKGVEGLLALLGDPKF